MKNYKILIIHILFLLIVGCSKKKSVSNVQGAEAALENKAFFRDFGTVKPYNTNSQFATETSKCIYGEDEKTSCTLSKLPLLGISEDKITVKSILDRTLISHSFLGEAFKQMLMRMNQETLQMFGSINAVVISDKINPSFYYSTSGAIYLSGEYFWSDVEQRGIVTQVKDYRSEYGTSLQFGDKNDYFKSKKSIEKRVFNDSRTYDEMFYPVVSMIIHELTHANDYFPRSFYRDSTSLDLSLSYKEISNDRFYNYKLISDHQPGQLTSEILIQLGEVLFRGKAATEAQKSLLAIDVTKAFQEDVAVDFYSYSSSREDFANNAEISLMLHFYDVSRFTTIFKYPESNFIVPKDYEYQIVWGQKDRILVPAIKERALYAVEKILGTEISQKMSEKFENSSVLQIPANTPIDDIYNF